MKICPTVARHTGDRAYMLQCSMAVALGGRAVGSRRFGGGTLAPEAYPGLFPRRLASLIDLAGPSGPALFYNTPDVPHDGEKASLNASLGHTLAGWSIASRGVTRQPAKQMIRP